MPLPTIETVPPARRLLQLEEVAEMLGHNARWLKLHRAELEKQNNFPAPILTGRPSDLRWDSRAIELWLDTQLPPHLRPLEREEDLDDIALRRELHSRAIAIAL